MSFENNITGTNSCKQRFKAIEGFLRRVAFNLGNSPSQTEVKIISCIPVDVTDLQQQICQLQKELDETKKCNVRKENPCVAAAAVQSIMHVDACPSCHNARYEREVNTDTLPANDGFQKSSSYMLAAGSTSKQQRSDISILCTSDEELPDFCPDVANAEQTVKAKCKTKNIFSVKKKTNKKPNKCATQYVYCAQTETKSPFANKSRPKTAGIYSKNLSKEANRVGRSYLANIIERAEREIPYSEFSSPVCRDSIPTCSRSSPYESDMCSCCHGQFQNIDDHMDHIETLNSYPIHPDTAHGLNRNGYYDSNLYDLVPVKEKPIKVKTMGSQKRKEPRKAQIKCVHQTRPLGPVTPTIVNYCTVPPVQEQPKILQKRRDHVMNRMAAKEFKATPHPQRDYVPSNICSVDYSTVYTKKIENEKKSIFPTHMYTRNDAACSPIMVNNANCQTTELRADPPLEDKTEITLNQIKSILQSVLTEVKTNVKQGNPTKLPQKDAVVQKGSSQGEAFESQLNSYTFSPYNMNPYVASCSRQIPSSHFTYPGIQDMTGRCMQQYPLLIQPQNRTCDSCFTPSSINKTAKIHRTANTATATNTEPIKRRSRETEQLIKEIYKSLNVGIEATKNMNTGVPNCIKSIVKKSETFLEEDDKESEEVADSISEIFRNANPLDSTITRTTDVTSVSKFTSDKYFVESQHAMLKSRISEEDEYSRAVSKEREIETVQMSRDLASESQSEDTEQSSTDGTDEVTARDTKKEKDGIFKKMFNMFKPRQRRRKENDDAKGVCNESESDSEDYQTVYSHKVVDKKPKIVARSRPHSKVFYSKQPQQKRSRTRSPEQKKPPYMEQEYRRQWDEKLAFHEGRHSSEKTRYATSSPRRQTPVYYQNYEARSALVDNVRRVPLRMAGNVLKNRYIDNPSYPANSHSSRNRTHYHQHGSSPNYPGAKSNYNYPGARSNYNYPGGRSNYNYPGARSNYNNPGARSNYTGNHRYEANNYHTGNNQTYRGSSPRYSQMYHHSPNMAINSNIVGNSRRNKQAMFSRSSHNGQPKIKSKAVMSSKRLAWLKRSKLNRCGKQWKELIFDG